MILSDDQKLSFLSKISTKLSELHGITSYENELFKKNNFNINNINQYEPDLNQNNYPNNNFNINYNGNQNLIQLNNIDNIPIPKEYIEKLGGINNLNKIIYNFLNK